LPEVLIPGVQQYNGSGADIDHYQQWRNAITLDDTFTFSPRLVGSFRYGFARRLNYETWGGVGMDPAQFKTPALVVAKGYSLEQFTRLMQQGVGLGERQFKLMSPTAKARFTQFRPDEVAAVYAFLQTL